MKVDDIKCPICGGEVKLKVDCVRDLSEYSELVKCFFLKCENCGLSSRNAEVEVKICDNGEVETNNLELAKLIDEWSEKSGK